MRQSRWHLMTSGAQGPFYLIVLPLPARRASTQMTISVVQLLGKGKYREGLPPPLMGISGRCTCCCSSIPEHTPVVKPATREPGNTVFTSAANSQLKMGDSINKVEREICYWQPVVISTRAIFISNSSPS